MRIAALAALAAASLLLGDAGLSWPDGFVLAEIRAPRTALALLVGAGLGGSGAALQGALRNRLADPGLLGVTGSAGLFAAIAFYWGFSQTFALPLAGILGAALGTGALLWAAGKTLSGPSLLLAGIAVAAIAGAALTLALSLAPNPFALSEITTWLMGSLEDRAPVHVAIAAPPILAGLVVLAGTARGLDALTLGEDTAATLGFSPAATLRAVALGTALAAGGGAAVAGGIGFVGLIVPNLLRGARGPGALVRPSMLGGAALLLAADMFSRAAPLFLPLSRAPPLGVLTALLGAPALIVLIRRA